MVFSRYLFLFFFLPAVLACYYISPKRWKHLVLTLFSYVFYGWANPAFMLLMLFTTMVDYTNGRIIGGSDNPRVRKLAVIIPEHDSQRTLLEVCCHAEREHLNGWNKKG